MGILLPSKSLISSILSLIKVEFYGDTSPRSQVICRFITYRRNETFNSAETWNLIIPSSYTIQNSPATDYQDDT